MRRNVAIGIVLGVLLPLITVPLAVISMGAGHGDYFLAKLLFPYLMLIAGLVGQIPEVLAFVSLLQYPIYGYFIGRSSFKMKTAANATILHIVVIGLSFIWSFG